MVFIKFLDVILYIYDEWLLLYILFSEMAKGNIYFGQAKDRMSSWVAGGMEMAGQWGQK